MELNSCENIKYIRKSWIDFINKIEDGLKDLNIEYFNMHLGYVISERLYKNRIKYLDNSVSFFEELLKVSNKRLSIVRIHILRMEIFQILDIYVMILNIYLIKLKVKIYILL